MQNLGHQMTILHYITPYIWNTVSNWIQFLCISRQVYCQLRPLQQIISFTLYWRKSEMFMQWFNTGWLGLPGIYLFGVLRRFQHCTGHITTGSWKGRGNQYIQLVRVLYCKLPTNGKQLPAFPLEAIPRPQRWEARVLPLCHCGPQSASKGRCKIQSGCSMCYLTIMDILRQALNIVTCVSQTSIQVTACD